MRLTFRRLGAASLSLAIVGCGGGIETGMPKQPQEMDPVHKDQMKEMGKAMMKGPGAFSGKKK